MSSNPTKLRRQRAREQLEEASEIASLLAAGDEAPVISRTAQQARPSPPKNATEHEALAALRSCILQRDPREKMDSILRACPEAAKFLTTSTVETTQEKKGKKSNKKNETKIDESTEKIDDSPESSDNDDSPESLCVHLAATMGNIEAFECIYYTDPDCVELADTTGKTPLHMSVLGGYLRLAESICNRAPQCCHLLDFEGNLSLHLAVGDASLRNKEAPLITSTLLATYPRGMTIRNKQGLLPLHIAAKWSFAPGIRGLLAVSAMSVHERASAPDGAVLPVDWALTMHNEVSKKLQTLKKVRPNNNNRTDRRNARPGAVGEDSVTLETLIEAIGKPLTERDLIVYKGQYEECIEMLLMSALYCRPVFMPREETHRDGADAPFFLPLHTAFCNRLTKESWDHLLSMYGKLHCSDIDRDGRTLLHVLAESCEDRDKKTKLFGRYADEQLISMVGQLHKMDPTLHSRRDFFGLIPLQAAVVSGASADVVEALLQCGKETARTRWVEYAY